MSRSARLPSRAAPAMTGLPDTGDPRQQCAYRSTHYERPQRMVARCFAGGAKGGRLDTRPRPVSNRERGVESWRPRRTRDAWRHEHRVGDLPQLRCWRGFTLGHRGTATPRQRRSDGVATLDTDRGRSAYRRTLRVAWLDGSGKGRTPVSAGWVRQAGRSAELDEAPRELGGARWAARRVVGEALLDQRHQRVREVGT